MGFDMIPSSLSTPVGGAIPQAPEGKYNPFESPPELGWPLRVKSHSQQTSSSDSRHQAGAAYIAHSPPFTYGADQSPRWPDVQAHARSMLAAVPKKEKDAIPGIETFNVERITALLSEVYLIPLFWN